MYKSQFRKIDPGFVVQGHEYELVFTHLTAQKDDCSRIAQNE